MSAPKLVLASGSSARLKMLQHAGYDFETCPADIDEEKLRQNLKNKSPKDIAIALAAEKTRAVSEKFPGAIIIGSDQICAIKNEIFTKAKDKSAAFEKIKSLQGRTHELHSAAVLFRDRREIYSFCDTVFMTMKTLSDKQIENYIGRTGSAVTECAGAYAIEETGARLFDKIEGDYFSILGMPLLPLISALDKEGYAL